MAILSNTNSNASNDNNNTSSASNTSSKSNNSNTCNNHSNGGNDRNTTSNASNDSKYYKQLLAMTASTASYLLCVLLLPLTAHVAACLLLLLPTHLALLLFLLWSAQSPFSASRQQNSKTAKQESRAAQGQHRFALEIFSNKCQSLYFRLQLGAWPNCCHSGLWIHRFPVRVLVSKGSTAHRS